MCASAISWAGFKRVVRKGQKGESTGRIASLVLAVLSSDDAFLSLSLSQVWGTNFTTLVQTRPGHINIPSRFVFEKAIEGKVIKSIEIEANLLSNETDPLFL